VGLEDWSDARPAELSGGMKQRVGLARALATDADVLLMDEPFSALDPLIRRDMQDLLAGLRRELGKTIVFITHDLNEAMRLGDRILILRDGRTVQLGTRSELLSAPADGYVEDFVADVDRSRVLTAADALDPETDAADGRRDGAVSADRPLVDLVPVLAGREEPVAVVGSDGQPLGAVSRRSLLEALAPATRTATHA
jgi:glycine betaine/proline transport system ATP-binding protein